MKPISKKPQTIAEYAPLKHSFRGDGYRFDHDMQIDIGWRDLTMNCLFFDPSTRLLFDPGQQALDDILHSRLRPVASGSYHPPGALAIRLFRLLKFTVRPEFDRCNYSEAAAWLSAHLAACLSDFCSFPCRDKDEFRPTRRDRVLLRFYKTLDSLRDDRANNWQNLRNACAGLNEALTAAGADLDIWSAGVQEMTS